MKKPITFPRFPVLDSSVSVGTKGSPFLTKIVAIAIALAPTAKAQFRGSEDFSRPLSLQKWFAYTKGSGRLFLSNQEFNFTSTSSIGGYVAGLPWVSTTVPNSQDWQFQLDVENMLSVSDSTRYASIGISVVNENDEPDLAYLEFYSSYFNVLGQSIHGFTSGLKNNGTGLHEGDTFEPPYNTGALRANYGRSERSLSFYFHTGSTSGGYFWQLLAKYGLDGNDGTTANTDWAMIQGAGFDVGLYGTATGSRPSVGQLTADNFTTANPGLGVHTIDFELEAPLTQAGDAMALSWFSFDGLEDIIQESHDLINWTELTSVPGTGAYSGLEVPLAASTAPAFDRIYLRIP
jgi:hypothetical protein